MGPFVDRVADEIRHAFGVFLELFAVGGIAGDVFLVDPHLAHQTPLVMVAIAIRPNPAFGDVLEFVIVGDLLRDQMAMEVEDRHLGRMLVVKLLGERAIQEEVFA